MRSKSHTTERARELRNNPTPAEAALWRLLKPLRQQGHHFRRQVSIGPYFAGFVVHQAGLVIEVDGDTHAVGQGPLHDARRDAYLRQYGFRVLRVSNTDVHTNPEGAYAEIAEALEKASDT